MQPKEARRGGPVLVAAAGVLAALAGLGLGSGGPGRVADAMVLPPSAPEIPGGVADAHGLRVFVGGASGGIDAIELATGKRVWTSPDGEWPLHTTLAAIVVAASDPARRNALRIRFLSVSTGKRLTESEAIVLPTWALARPPWRSDAASLDVEAWTPVPARGPKPPDPFPGWLRVRWDATWTPGSGMGRPAPPEVASGFCYVDPASGAVKTGPEETSPRPAEATLLDGWKAEPRVLYWWWSDSGSAWTGGPPRPFRTASAVMGYLALEGTAPRRLLLHRWRPFEPLGPVEIASGHESYYPIVTMDGRYLILRASKPKELTTVTLYDLFTLAKSGAGRRLPPLEPGFRMPIAILGETMYYVVERSGPMSPGGGMIYERELLALDVAKGAVRWRAGLAPRHVGPPSPGPR